MFRMMLGLVAALVVCINGCGGGGSSSSGDPTSVVVRVETTRVNPKFVTVRTGDTVQWLNATNQARQVVSGTLDPIGNPLVIRTITIGNAGFTPTDTVANLGDTIRFSNLSSNTFFLDIVDDDGNVISSLTLPVGDLQVFQFPGAGRFTIRNRNNQLFAGNVTLLGGPNPSGAFISSLLSNGGSFSRQFTTVGSFPYFILDPATPNTAFITGTIVVQ